MHSSDTDARALVVSGGGVHGAMMLGSLYRDYPLFFDGQSPLKVAGGTSVGAIIAALMVLGAEPLDVLHRVIEELPIVEYDLMMWVTGPGFGMASQAKLQRVLETFVRNAGYSERVTFRELWDRTGIELVVCASDLTAQTPIYFNPREHGDVEVVEALLASSCVPLLFPYRTCKKHHHVLVDGMLYDNFPVDYVIEYTAKHYASSRFEVSGYTYKNDSSKPTLLPNSALSYLTTLIRTCARPRESAREGPRVRIHTPSAPTTVGLGMGITAGEPLRELFYAGASASA